MLELLRGNMLVVAIIIVDMEEELVAVNKIYPGFSLK